MQQILQLLALPPTPMDILASNDADYRLTIKRWNDKVTMESTNGTRELAIGRGTVSKEAWKYSHHCLLQRWAARALEEGHIGS